MAILGRFFRDPGSHYFLFGPRGTGKSTWLRAAYPDALWLDLLEPEAQQRIKSIGFDPIVKSHAETVEYFNSEVASWGRMTRAVGYSVN